jgi:phage-related tail fiber protein
MVLDQGRAEQAIALANGDALKPSAFGIGTTSWTPQRDDTALKTEVRRVDIADRQPNGHHPGRRRDLYRRDWYLFY